jgi:ribonuclease-3 family protein
MIENTFDTFLEQFNFSESEINNMAPLVLAYIGDAVYEVFIRTLLISEGNIPVHKLHKRSIEYVRAKAQSDIIHRIMEKLNPDELNVVRRGRNAKSGTIPKNADVGEYKYATGFESLIGYLYLRRDNHRLMEVLKMAISEE